MLVGLNEPGGSPLWPLSRLGSGPLCWHVNTAKQAAVTVACSLLANAPHALQVPVISRHHDHFSCVFWSLCMGQQACRQSQFPAIWQRPGDSICCVPLQAAVPANAIPNAWIEAGRSLSTLPQDWEMPHTFGPASWANSLRGTMPGGRPSAGTIGCNSTLHRGPARKASSTSWVQTQNEMPRTHSRRKPSSHLADIHSMEGRRASHSPQPEPVCTGP